MLRPERTCPHARGQLYAVPAPLYGERRGDPPAPIPDPAPVPVTRCAETEELRIIRYKHPIPDQSTQALNEAVCLLRRENTLLSEILTVLRGRDA